jgi:hypothetical protein
MNIFSSNKIEQFNLISQNKNKTDFLNVDIFNQDFKQAIINIDIKKYKDDPDKDTKFYNLLSFSSETYNDKVLSEDKDVIESLVKNSEYNSVMFDFFNINRDVQQNYYITYDIIQLKDEKVQLMKTSIKNATENKNLGAHVIPLFHDIPVCLYRKDTSIESPDLYDYSLFSKINYSYDTEYIFKCDNNQYFGMNSNTNKDLIKYLIITFIKK